jgi:uncharacterized protein with FMN-binding domain
MKRILISAATVVAFVVYALSQRGGAPAAVETASSASTTSPPTSPVAADRAAPSAGLSDGTYTGSQENAFYGVVQVQAVVNGGRLTDVQFLRYPSDRRTSQQINQRALPVLESEAITAQSANVDSVTGATFTSEAFMASLDSALSQAVA